MQVLGLDGSQDKGPGAEAEADQDGRVKPAAHYFQRMMTQEVLPGLVYSCCEVCIDDGLVYGRTEDEYIQNLRLVFHKFREKKITINPGKCIFGADEVGFVGHVLDAEVATFSRTKFDSVVGFIKPPNMKELRSCAGVVIMLGNTPRIPPSSPDRYNL